MKDLGFEINGLAFVVVPNVFSFVVDVAILESPVIWRVAASRPEVLVDVGVS